MLSAVVVSGAASAAVLRRLELELIAPQNAFAMRPVTLRVNLHNPRLWMPAFSVKVFSPSTKRKETGMGWRKTEFVFPQAEQLDAIAGIHVRAKAPAPRQAKF